MKSMHNVSPMSIYFSSCKFLVRGLMLFTASSKKVTCDVQWCEQGLGGGWSDFVVCLFQSDLGTGRGINGGMFSLPIRIIF